MADETKTTPPTVYNPKLIKSPKVALALALLSAALLSFGFAGFDVWPFALIAQVPMLLVLRGRTPKQAFRIGWLTGSIAITGGFYWIAPMLQNFSGFPIGLCILFASLLWIAQGLQFALFYWLVARADARGHLRLLSVPLLFGALEFIFPALFPWYYANSLHNVPLLIQTADLGGVIFVGALMSIGHVCLERAIAQHWLFGKTSQAMIEAQEAHEPRRVPAKAWGAWALIPVLTWGLAIAYGAYRIHEVDVENRTAPSLRVGVVQQNLGLQEKRTDPRTALARHLDASHALEDQHVDLIVWSESSIAYLFDQSITNTRDSIRTWDLRTPVLFGALSEREGKLYNTAFLSRANGDLAPPYDKTFLLAFGEYLPFGDTFPQLYRYSPNSGHFTPGARPVAIDLPPASDGRTYRVAPLICYEDVLPRFVHRFQRETDTQLFAVILNDAWFGDTTEPWIHLALSKFRSIEHRRDFVRSANSGVSGFVDAAGRVLAHTKTFTRESATATVHLRTRRTIYSYVGDWFAWLCLASALYLGFGPKRKSPLVP